MLTQEQWEREHYQYLWDTAPTPDMVGLEKADAIHEWLSEVITENGYVIRDGEVTKLALPPNTTV